MTDDDSTLLRTYAENRDHAAFAELVKRYLNLVYFAALRQVNQNAHRAEDVTQSVFTLLAQKAANLKTHETLAGWLYTTARNLAKEANRAERRRLNREQEAHLMEDLSSDPASDAAWEQLRPMIDSTLTELNDRDREAVLLRFFVNLPHAQIGQKLGISENTARMRVERALARLHSALAKRGITSTAAALSLVLANQALASAPTGLGTTITSVALAGATKTAIAATTTTATTNVLSFMTTTKLVIGTSGLVTLTAALLTWQQWQTNAILRHDLSAVRQQTATLRAENQRLIAASKPEGLSHPADRAVHNEPSGTADGIAHQPAGPSPIGSALPATGADSDAAALTPMVPIELAAKKAGRDTPADAARTLLWYLQGGDVKHAADLLSFEPAEKEKLKDFIDSLPESLQETYSTPAKLIAFAMAGSPKPITGVQLLSENQPDDYTSIQHVRLEYKNGEVREDDIHFHRDVDGWKEIVSPATVDRVITYLKKQQ